MGSIVTTTADNTDVIETLWHKHYADLRRYIYRRLPVDQVEDALQTVWLLALEAMRRGNGYTDNARGWLFRIARNLLIDMYRWHERHAPVDLEDTLPDGGSVTDRVLARLEAQQVRRSVNKLLPTQAEIIRLRYLEGYEFAEIAERMDMTVGAVKAHAQRAYRRMHADLGEEFGYGEERTVTLSNSADEVAAVLQERGPLAETELTKATRVKPGSVYYALRRFPDRFVRVDTMTTARGAEAYIWGLAGVHDVQEAA